MINREKQIFERYSVASWFGRSGIARSINQATRKSTSGKQIGIAASPVITTAGGVHLRSSSEFRRYPEQRCVEHPTLFKIGHHSSNGMVERRHLVEAASASIHVRIPFSVGDGDKPRPCLNQPASQYQSFRETFRVEFVIGTAKANNIPTVKLHRLFRLAIERKRRLRLRRRQQRVGTLVKVVHRVEY